MAKYVLTAFADEAAGDAAGQIKALKKNGVTFIEPRLLDGAPLIDKTEEEIKEFRAALDKAGIKVSSFGSPIGKYEIEKSFEPHFERFKWAVEIAKLLGTDRMRIFSFFVPADKLDEYRDEVISRLTKMVAYAKEHGITLCHENEEKIYGEAPERVADLLAAVPGLASVWDAANYILTDNDPKKGYEASKSTLSYIHIKDALGYERIVTPAGEGEGCIKDVLLQHGDSTDDTVYLTLEPHLAVFEGYDKIDGEKLNHKFYFESNRAAFDAAVSALKGVLTTNGYTEINGGFEK